MMVNSKQSKRAVIFKGNINRDFDKINYDDQKTEEYDDDDDERRPVNRVSDGDIVQHDSTVSKNCGLCFAINNACERNFFYGEGFQLSRPSPSEVASPGPHTKTLLFRGVQHKIIQSG